MSSYAILCAVLVVRRSGQNKPYPVVVVAANQGQHSSGSRLSTLRQNLVAIGSISRPYEAGWGHTQDRS